MKSPMFRPPHLEDLLLLCAVVDQGSFSAAARHAGSTQPRVSRAIGRLEERLGIPLVRRSSRSIAVTPEGLRYASHARSVLDELQELELELVSPDVAPGPLRVSAPPALARRVLMPHLTSHCRAHPETQLVLSLEARRVDLIEEGIDVAIRFGPLQDTWRRARRLIRGRYHMYAAPELELEPAHPDVIADWPALVLNATHLRHRWPLVVDGETQFVSVTPSLVVDDVDAMLAFAVAGLGATIVPDFMVAEEEASGALLRLTTDAQALQAEVFAVTASPSPRASLYVEHLATRLQGAQAR